MADAPIIHAETDRLWRAVAILEVAIRSPKDDAGSAIAGARAAKDLVRASLAVLAPMGHAEVRHG